MKNITTLLTTVLTTTSALFLGQIESASALMWDWSYSTTGIDASGTFTTNDTPDDWGFYTITDISGTRNSEIITGLQPTGTSIPGNEPFEVDNVISLELEQLTSDGFGFATSEGNFVNVFFANFLNPPGYFEIFSAPPFIPGFENLGPEDSELPINFSANPILVPEPNFTLSFLALGIFGTASLLKRKLKQ